MFLICRLGVLLLVLSMVCGLALAQETQPEGPLDILLESFVVTTVVLEDGTLEEQFTPADKVNPGDVIEYRVVMTNLSDEALGSVQAQGPVPEATFYLGETATQDDSSWLEFSADGGETFSAEPLTVTVLDENGEEQVIVLQPSQYTTARWTMLTPLSAEESRIYSYRVTVR